MSSSHASTPRSPPSAATETLVFSNTYIQRSRPYLTDAQIEFLRPDSADLEAKDAQTRLNACAWIMQVGTLLQFPVRTMATAMILCHRFLLFNRLPWLDSNYADAAAASLFVACKIEDTLKKSREILAGGINIRHPGSSEHINPDSKELDEAAKRVIGIERMILETSSFDFRNRHAQPFLLKFARALRVDKTLCRRAWRISVDVYRTLAPLRATPHALALACLDLAARLDDRPLPIAYAAYEADRDTVLSVMDDLLDLYTNHAVQTLVGPTFTNTVFLNQRIELNRERKRLTNGHEVLNNNINNNGGSNGNGNASAAKQSLRIHESDRGTQGCIRFMLDPEREREESAMLKELEKVAAANGIVAVAAGRPVVAAVR